MQRFPFFLIVDDGGFPFAVPEERQGPIGLDTYQRIVALARKFGVRIPICFTLKYLDSQNISGRGQPLDYVDELVGLLRENSAFIEIGYHGLSHENDHGTEEFYCLTHNEAISESEQRGHFKKSLAILASWGLDFPSLFVPPYHAWEQDVTDHLAAEFGVRWLISYLDMDFRGRHYEWRESKYLELLPRSSIGLNGRDYDINCRQTRRIRLWPGEFTLFDFMKAHIIPQNIFQRIRFSKTLIQRPVHSYMTHIGNFSQSAMELWHRVFDYVLKNKRLHVCQDTVEAAEYYRHLAESLRKW